MPDRMEYQLTLQKDGRFDIYESASVFAGSDDEAVQKAKDWRIRSVRPMRTLGFW